MNMIYTTQEINKNLIHQSYNDFKKEINNYYNFINNLNIKTENIIEYNKLNYKNKQEYMNRNC
jgi:hypothetical protein